MASDSPEPWLRGSLQNIPAHVRPVFFSFIQVEEDLDKHVSPLLREQIWMPSGNSSIGFHLQHMAGSVDRLTTYLMGRELSSEQLGFLRAEGRGDLEATNLVELVRASLRRSEEQILTIDSRDLFEPRFVGRKRLPTTVIGLLVHLAEHTQRHLGQVITASKIFGVPADV